MSNTEDKIITKEDERKALTRIKKIIASLGEDSYVGTAFEGCFEIAESNIENDWACSMKQRSDNWEIECGKLCSEIDELKRSLESEQNLRNIDVENIATLRSNCATYTSEIEGYKLRIRELTKENEDMVTEVSEKDDEIIRLKARLYDLMVK